MTRASPTAIRFVRALLGGATALPDGKGRFHVAIGERMARLDAGAVAALVSEGVLSGGGTSAGPRPTRGNGCGGNCWPMTALRRNTGAR